MGATRTTTVGVGGLHWATSGAVVEKVLGRRPGVLAVHANAVGQTATVTFDPSRTSIDDLAGWVRDCGYHCAGQSVPEHVCEPMVEPPHDGHGAHDEMSMDDMVRDMRNRFGVAAVLSVPVPRSGCGTTCSRCCCRFPWCSTPPGPSSPAPTGHCGPGPWT